MSFSADIDKAYQVKVIDRLEKTVRTVALAVDRELVMNTPVDTGRARSNWLPSIGSPDIRIVEPGAKPDITGATLNYSLKSEIFITNNLPYIRRLNDGHSQQAPAGFVETAINVGVSKAKRLTR